MTSVDISSTIAEEEGEALESFCLTEIRVPIADRRSEFIEELALRIRYTPIGKQIVAMEAVSNVLYIRCEVWH